jgi:hypothetical protein
MGDGFGVLEKDFQQKEVKTFLNFEPKPKSLQELWLKYKFGMRWEKTSRTIHHQGEECIKQIETNVLSEK